jgi:hypothetical protein
MKEKREQPIKTKKGIILYNKGGDKWWIEYPDGDRRYGGATTIRVMNLIYHIGQGKSIDKADELAFGRAIK